MTEFFYLGTFGPDHPAFAAVEQFMVALMVRWTRYGASPQWNPARVNVRAGSIPLTTLRALVGDADIRCAQGVTSIVFPAQPFLGPMEDLPKKGSAIWRRHRSSLRDTAGTGSRRLSSRYSSRLSSRRFANPPTGGTARRHLRQDAPAPSRGPGRHLLPAAR